jgi:hypothetical protein
MFRNATGTSLRNDFGRFLDVWAHDADVLGWRPDGLLGWDPARPYTPIAKVIGPIWKFDGAAVVGITRTSITTKRGTYRVAAELALSPADAPEEQSHASACRTGRRRSPDGRQVKIRDCAIKFGADVIPAVLEPTDIRARVAGDCRHCQFKARKSHLTNRFA